MAEFGLDFESRRPKYIGGGFGQLQKADRYKGHYRGVIRYRPNHSGLDIHTHSQHASHGVGSFCRTHSHPTCRR